MRLGAGAEMKLQFIRHGKTQGNLEKRYIGSTDELLCAQGRAELKQAWLAGVYQSPQVLCSSPLQRCLETCALLFPEKLPIVHDGLRETDFGIFEGKSYADLQDSIAYQNWLDSGCTAEIPQGESKSQFQARCCMAFLDLLRQYERAEQITLVVHGGVIMAILEQFAWPPQNFYSYHLENGDAQIYQWDGQWPVRLYREEG